jgi:hypothetical protein
MIGDIKMNGATPVQLHQGLNAGIQIIQKMRSIFNFLF